jgi:two-component system, OmpR family, sensor histidine kinase PrrB
VSLRLRVAAVTTLVTFVVVGLAGAVLIALVAREERQQVDEDLEQFARLAASRGIAELRTGDDQSVRAPLGLVGRVRVDGQVEVEFGDYPLDPTEVIERGYSTRRIDGERWRFASVPAAEALPDFPPVLRGGLRLSDVTVEVAQPLATLTNTVESVTRQVVRLGALALVVAGVLGWLLGGAALRPLARLRSDAERVSGTRDPGERVADQQGLREVDELGRSLNVMLERLQAASQETAVALEASRSFAANAAHELRTPLTSIQANIDVLARNPTLEPAERAVIIDDIQVQQQRLVRLLSALRLLARGDLEQVPLEAEIDLADVVEASIERARRHHPDASFELAQERGACTVPGWEEGLQVLVDNLLDNAAIHGRRPDAPARVSVALWDDGHHVEVVVDDNGPGIPAEERSAVMERFTRATGTTAPGSGLGLALVRQQAMLHGGDVTVSDSPSGGARLAVRLPRSVPRVDAGQEPG